MNPESQLTLDDYQNRALKTDVLPGAGEHPAGADQALLLPLLGLAGEVGQLAAQVKKRARDQQGYVGFKDEVAEELGDALWYLAVLADRSGIRLSDVATRNLSKSHDTFAPFDPDLRSLYDDAENEDEQLPWILTLRFTESIVPRHGHSVPTVTVNVADEHGEALGDPLDDNSVEDDDYRYHDIFHLANMAVLGWSPVMRTVLRPKRKRRSDRKDRVEDGGRGIAIEEGLTAAVFTEARGHSFFGSAERVPTDLLKLCRRMTLHLEVADRSNAQWQEAILVGYRAFNQLRAQKGGTVTADVVAGTLRVECA